MMSAVKDGDMRAFSELMSRHQQSLLNFFYRMGVYNDAEDLVQEAFVRLYNYRDRYRPTAKFTTFLYMIGRQVRLDLARKEVRKEAFVQKYSKDVEEQNLPNRSAAENRRIDIEPCLEKLPEQMREVIVLSFYQNLKYLEIAEILDIPVGTVKSRMFNAMNELRSLINEQSKQ